MDIKKAKNFKLPGLIYIIIGFDLNDCRINQHSQLIVETQSLEDLYQKNKFILKTFDSHEIWYIDSLLPILPLGTRFFGKSVPVFLEQTSFTN